MSNQAEWDSKFGKDDDWESQAAAANNSYKTGFDAAVRAHASVVAAAVRVVEQYIKSEDIPQGEVARSIITLAGAVDNLKTTLEIGLDTR